MLKKRYVDTPGGQIHVRYRPGTNLPIVFLHQTASSSDMFTLMMEQWPGEQALYAVDTPGFGGSFEPEGLPSMRDYGEMVVSALDGLGIERAHIFGHHTGASIAIEMAVAYADRFVSLSMIGPVTITRDEAQTFEGLYPKDFALKADGGHLKMIWDYVAEIGGASSLALHHREFTDTARAWNGHIRVYSTIWQQDFLGLFQQVKQPMLIMCSPDDVLWPIFERAKTLRPDAVAVVLPGTNFQPDEAPAEVNAALLEFLTTVKIT